MSAHKAIYDNLLVNKDNPVPPKINGYPTKGLNIPFGDYWVKNTFVGICLIRRGNREHIEFTANEIKDQAQAPTPNVQ